MGGGGNCSLKTSFVDITGRTVPLLLVKASGHAMSSLETDGLAPLRRDGVQALLPPVVVPDAELLNALRCCLVDAFAPDPSVETLIHALLPQTVVLHSHADAILTLSNSRSGIAKLRALLPDCVFVEYAMPGPDLVAACDAAWKAAPAEAAGLVVLGHGLFTVGDSPQQALTRHLGIAQRAQTALNALPGMADGPDLPPTDIAALARLRRDWCARADKALILRHFADPQVSAFVTSPALLDASQAGPLTPDHVNWTKRVPQIGTDFDAYAAAYQAYVETNRHRRGGEITAVEPAPRVLLDETLGMVTAGRTPSDAETTAEIYRHTMTAIEKATHLGGYLPADASHVFDLEYWSFQQAKTERRDDSGPLRGQIALVTGAASGIGRGCAAALLGAGATVVGWDLSESITTTFDSPNFVGLRVDVTDAAAVAKALATQVDLFGGLDILVPSAGIFPTSANLAELPMADWRRTMSINVDSVVDLYHQTYPLLAAAYPYGRVVLVASKNVIAPGPGAAAYSASKSAVAQISRVAAMEWAGDGIRVNMVHPDAVFDTGLWTPELLQARADHYGM
ncbi:MAG: SDR family NAD(P)-dependent oxidoreductase, partial [Propionibacteriaceae bacterium]|nr:SDR family NAD(P)-dependent oxidoreductase [Propionibacteriaceae bacterium]